MGLPRDTDSYASYADQLVYFAARLEANPATASLAAKVDALLDEIDADNEALKKAQRAEIRARARRDHEDAIGDASVRRFKRRIDVVGDSDIAQRLFPRGLKHAVAASGRQQLQRLTKIIQAIEELANSQRVAKHPEAEEIVEILDQGKATLSGTIDTLTPLIEAWESEVAKVSRALDNLRFSRSNGRRRLGMVMGELRAVLGGDEKAAYAYTQQSSGARRSEASSEDEDEASTEDEG